jgi:oligoribonuclease NrnB/cAMP/cGMP phosphodiesterase (DHH superfamily)
VIPKKPIVIYHANCLDGFTAAWAFYDKYGDTMEYVPGVYQGTVPDVTDRHVFLVDFSYKRDIVEAMLLIAKSVTLIDHHKSALEDLWDLETKGLNVSQSSLSRSGAVLAWLYVNRPNVKIPKVIQHIQDRDLWLFEKEGTKEICAYLYNKLGDTTLKDWGQYMAPRATAYSNMVSIGAALVEDHTKLAVSAAKYTRPITLGGVEVPMVNCMPFASSEVGNILAMENPFGVTYIDMKDCRNFSLRSDKSNPNAVDVSKIAQQYGGGGHWAAAGFRVPRDHELAKV